MNKHDSNIPEHGAASGLTVRPERTRHDKGSSDPRNFSFPGPSHGGSTPATSDGQPDLATEIGGPWEARRIDSFSRSRFPAGTSVRDGEIDQCLGMEVAFVKAVSLARKNDELNE